MKSGFIKTRNTLLFLFNFVLFDFVPQRMAKLQFSNFISLFHWSLQLFISNHLVSKKLSRHCVSSCFPKCLTEKQKFHNFCHNYTRVLATTNALSPQIKYHLNNFKLHTYSSWIGHCCCTYQYYLLVLFSLDGYMFVVKWEVF